MGPQVVLKGTKRATRLDPRGARGPWVDNDMHLTRLNLRILIKDNESRFLDRSNYSIYL